MLILSRHPRQRVLISGDIVITVLRVKSDGSVQLGFDAPSEVVIMREELVASDPNNPQSPRRRT